MDRNTDAQDGLRRERFLALRCLRSAERFLPDPAPAELLEVLRRFVLGHHLTHSLAVQQALERSLGLDPGNVASCALEAELQVADALAAPTSGTGPVAPSDDGPSRLLEQLSQVLLRADDLLQVVAPDLEKVIAAEYPQDPELVAWTQGIVAGLEARAEDA